MFLKGKGALVTGSTSGIGLGNCPWAGSAGCDGSERIWDAAGDLEAIRQDIENRFGVRASIASVDAADYDMRPGKAIATVETELGLWYSNNAGIQHVVPTQSPIEKWNKVIDINSDRCILWNSAVCENGSIGVWTDYQYCPAQGWWARQTKQTWCCGTD